ncbi:response regulator [Agrobacterium sp. ES01]|uniref:response regulator n=1 Tax=Agrobacterium sp. ES01 TaxID=3420714 RepID=UPI003D14E62C
MTRHSSLLKLASERIGDLPQPAYVKDCELRHVVVNAAYARFFGLSPDDFIGKTSFELFGRREDKAIEDIECKALVFGEEQEALSFEPDGPGRRGVMIERFVDEDESLYLFGEFLDGEADLPPVAAAPVQANENRPVADGLLKTIVEELPSPTFLRDADHKMLIVNKAYCDLLGLRKIDLLDKSEIETMGEDVGQHLYELNQSVLDDGTAFENEEIFGTPTSPVHVLTSRRRIIGDDGKPYLLGSFTNMSELKARETQLSEAQHEVEILRAQVESLLRAMPVGILLLDHEFRIEYANEAFTRMWAVPDASKLTGRSYLDMIVGSHKRGIYDPEGPSPAEIFADRKDKLKNKLTASWQFERPDGTSLSVRGKPLETGQYLLSYIDVSDLRAHERESALFRAAIEQMPVPMFVRDDDHRLVFVNAAYETLLGKTRDTLYGTRESDLFTDKAKRFEDENNEILTTGKSVQREHDFETVDKRKMSAITRINRITLPSGQHYIVGSISDVSALVAQKKELIQARSEAERLNDYLEGIMRTMPVGVMILTEDLNIEFANEKVYEIWDLSVDRPLEGVSFRDLSEANYHRGWTWAQDETFDKNFEDRAKELSQLEGTLQRELSGVDGKLVSITSKRMPDNKILLVYANMTDLREREIEIDKARAELERLGYLWQDATQVMSQGLAIIQDGVIIENSIALSRMLNAPASLLDKGNAWRHCFAFCARRGDFGAEALPLLREWHESIRANENFSLTFLADGTTWVQVEAIVSGRGHWMLVFTDMTEVKDRELELKALLARAEMADRVKSEFLANMSHEIRTPMNGVLGMAELLSKSQLETRQKTFVDIIVKSGNALLTIINDILDFSKIDAGQLKLRKATFDPVEAIEDVATLLSASASEKDLELIVRADPAMRHLLQGDAGRFRQIITNLLGNAIKFTETGHVLIEVSGEPQSNEQMMLSVRIEDTGIGIPEVMRQSIFEKFSQVDTSSTRRHEGTGLGLAITAGLVDLFGGHMEVESTVGAGSTFSIHIPLAISTDSKPQEGVPLLVKDARVVAIDDNPINRQILSEQLASWGFDGVAVDGGRQALTLLDEAVRLGLHVDALVIDYHMPEMNGVELARRIRADHRFDEIAIIFLTSMDMVGDDDILDELNIQAHLMKPARASMLRKAIIDVTRAARLKRGLNAAPSAGNGPNLPVAAKPTPLPAKPENTVPQGGSDLDVLVAEDNEVNQIVFTQILQATPLSFKIVQNGEEAVAAWERDNPRMILMDVSMPVMNGHEATRTIRAKENLMGARQHVPIVAVTAHALDSDRDMCLAAGMDDYLSKPISPELLEQKIAVWLKDFADARASSKGAQG